MDFATQTPLQARKTPVQSRSAATVEAIQQATIQVLLQIGPQRLTTVHVAKRAGVSVGTLYQYYGNKHALLHAVLERHLLQVTESVEAACLRMRGEELSRMIDTVIEAFFAAKFRHRTASSALYAIAADVDGAELVRRMSSRSQAAMIDLFQSSEELRGASLQVPVFLFQASLAAASRALLEKHLPNLALKGLQSQISTMAYAYLTNSANAVSASLNRESNTQS